jgi:hypothetical protein
MSAKTVALALAMTSLPLPAWAVTENVVSRPVEEKNLVSGKAQIDPAKGYIYFHGPARQNVLFLKTPNAEQRAAYESEWKTAFDKARKKYPDKLHTWERDVSFAKKAGSKIPPKPVEPTEQTFSMGNIETRMEVQTGPLFAYNKSDSDIGYLQEVEPGTYTLYGPAIVLPNGAASGKCYCMGSVKFEVAPGKVTNLGDFLAMQWVGANEPLRRKDPALADKPVRPVDYGLPASLAARPNQQADLRAAGKMNNFFGIIIDRMPAIPGVLDYQRDKVIDLKAQTADASQ